MGGIGLSLYPVQDLCAEAGVHWRGHGGFGGIALSHNVRTRAEVDEVVAAWTRAGGAVTHAARDMARGGYCAHVADPDGNIRDIAWNTGYPIDEPTTNTIHENKTRAPTPSVMPTTPAHQEPHSHDN